MRVVLVELKSRARDYGSIKEKFDNSVEVVNLLLSAQNTYCKIIPVLLAKAFNKTPSGSPIARGLYVKINGKRKSIIYGKCGMQLADIMAKK